MRPAAVRLREYLERVEIAAPGVPLINNVDVATPQDPGSIKDALVRQAASPVRWVETIQRMSQSGVTHVIECGPGKILAGLVKRIAPQLQGIALSDRAALEQALAALRGV